VVVGAGHCGLAASRILAEQAIDHVVLERGDVANSWRHERWDSLRLLTPNWLLRLPGQRYEGPDPHGYLGVPELVQFIERYAAHSVLPIRTRTAVTAVRPHAAGLEVVTTGGTIRARSVVLASGAGNAPRIPQLATLVPAGVRSLSTFEYRRPESLPEGAVLVVGASATGVQLADEIRRSGRRVILSVGEHVRLPRTYRGLDVLWWMDATGVWNQRYDQIEDLQRARRLPSPQLIGTAQRATLDLNVLRTMGVEIVGRLEAIRDGRALFSGGLANLLALADLKMERLLDTFDAWLRGSSSSLEVGPMERFEPTHAPRAPRLTLDLRSGEIASIVWATGFRPDYGWLDLPVLGRKGELVHEGGVVQGAPGLYAIGLPVLRRRKSTFIHGAEDDARDLVAHILAFLAAGMRSEPPRLQLRP
jgi:putative flavoprotein involved in K+ transport